MGWFADKSREGYSRKKKKKIIKLYTKLRRIYYNDIFELFLLFLFSFSFLFLFL